MRKNGQSINNKRGNSELYDEINEELDDLSTVEVVKKIEDD